MPLPISGTPEHDLYLLLKRHEDNIRQLLADNATLQSQVAALQTPGGGSYITEGDSRLSDPRDPNAHNHLLSDITDAGTAAPLDVPASGDAAAGEVVKGDDTRLTNDRDPNAHAADHASGGADQVDHDTLQNYDIAQHRVINDGGTSSIELWSADKISSEISAVVQGLDLKDSVETVADTNVTLSGEQTINGVITSASRVGVTGQSNNTENGIYTTGAGAWVRTADADDNDDITQGLSFFVASGDKAGFQYVLTTADPITVGSTGLTFSEVRKLGFGTTAGTAAEGNDSRIPTQDEKDALAGTSTPNGANPFVNQADFASTQSDVSNLQSDMSTAQSDISTNQSDISTNQFNISTNQSDISTLQSDVSTAQSDISTLQSDVSTNQSDIGTNQSDISTLQSDVSTAQYDISTNQGNISTLQSDISTAQSDISTNQGNISTLQSDVSTAQSDISTLQSDKLDASDPRIPTQDQRDALVGTGVPGSGDLFVNNSDSRLAQAQNFEIATKNLSASDDRVIVACDAATTADIDIDSATPSDTYDGVTLAAFDVLLVHNQADASENGVYVFTDTSTPLSRYVGLNTSAGFAGRKRQFVVRKGDTQKGMYISAESSGFTLDSDGLEFLQAFGTAAYLDTGTAANNVVQLDSEGNLPSVGAAGLTGLTTNAEFRGTDTPHLGGSQQAYNWIQNKDHSGFASIRNGRLEILTERGPFGLSAEEDPDEPDIEFWVNNRKFSSASLDSDERDVNGLPIRQGFNPAAIGGTQRPLTIVGREY